MADFSEWFAQLVASIKAQIDHESAMRRSERAKAAWAKRKKQKALPINTLPNSDINAKR
jgi:hypothetical protein